MSVTASIVNGEIQKNGVSSSQASTNISKAITASQKESGGSLDKDAFLRLLVTQMQYQDPLEPTDNTEYISQLATFSSLEEMQNMSSSMDMQRASGLVGQYVFLEETSDTTGNTETIEGTVDYVTYSGNKTYLSVGGTLYSLDTLQTVADADYTLAMKLADSVVGYINNLPDINKLTDSDYDKVGELVSAYSSMDTYQKSFLTSDETGVYNLYAEWYADKTEAMKEEKADNSADASNAEKTDVEAAKKTEEN